jgi:hypothetical protein
VEVTEGPQVDSSSGLDRELYENPKPVKLPSRQILEKDATQKLI